MIAAISKGTHDEIQSRNQLLSLMTITGWPNRRIPQSREKGERRSATSPKRLCYCVKINRTSLDHLLLGRVADIDEMSHEPSIARARKDSRVKSP